ncbi:flagellar basal body-associated FliL family protein [Alkalimarinus sediminis]|uniref:Flagellar protein FliL n=1 Tax=Alkalimarinus sediminis TaxID=1632866 RepID=A0A9E8KQE1_9ALTE|nr:flagellar basal body-associated FliL family protein [Alkalimarinus sediminis]UZW74602.1 flagellar basal body-associated protein FliL [Alkalimarinus sediminis]
MQTLWQRAIKRLTAGISLLVLAMMSSLSVAEEDGETAINVQYVDLKPSFVANFGGPATKLKFVKTDISVRANTVAAANLIEQHMPLIRNEIVLLLSAQAEADISSMEGQEKLRLEALERVKKVLEDETGSPTAEDLLFTNFVLQR